MALLSDSTLSLAVTSTIHSTTNNKPAITSRQQNTTKDTVTHLSSVAARMYLPFGENLTKETGGLSSSEKNTMTKLYAKNTLLTGD